MRQERQPQNSLARHLDPGSKSDSPTLRAVCEWDLRKFMINFFPDLCRLKWCAFHQHLIQKRLEALRTPVMKRHGTTSVTLAPRGSAKSTLASLIFPLHALMYGKEPYIVLISATQRQASQRLDNLRSVLLRNKFLHHVYGPRLNMTKKTSATTLELPGGKFEAFSAGTEMRGISHGPWRPTWIILDDVERSESVHSALQRDKLYDWFNEVVVNLGDRYTNIDLVGTLLHRDALPIRMGRRPDTLMTTWKSIITEPENATLWQQWSDLFTNLNDPDRIATARNFYQEHQQAMDRGSSVLWEAKESYYDLRVMRETRGKPAFDKEKQNEPWAEDSAVFAGLKLRSFDLLGDTLSCEPAEQSSWARPTSPVPPTLNLNELTIFGYLDPAMGHNSGDFASIVTVGLDRSGYTYLLDVQLCRIPPSEQIHLAFDLHERWNYAAFGIETNAFQAVLIEGMEAERAYRRTQGRPWQLPIKEVKHHGSKLDRIIALEPVVRNGWLLFNRSITQAFFDQLSEFPKGSHDDGPDALASCCDMINTHNYNLSDVVGVIRGSKRNLKLY